MRCSFYERNFQNKKIWGEKEKSLLNGKGIDIGFGSDPLNADVVRFDVDDGDANQIGLYVKDTFDFVYSSHCLEHMNDPMKALHEWWKLVNRGGILFFLVPDEDLYEQGFFPSRFNSDHKWTFTISKAKSWSPVSINVLDLVQTLKDSEIVSLQLQDAGYDYRLLQHGESTLSRKGFYMFLLRAYRALRRRGLPQFFLLEEADRYHQVTDQTSGSALAQIQCIVRKKH